MAITVSKIVRPSCATPWFALDHLISGLSSIMCWIKAHKCWYCFNRMPELDHRVFCDQFLSKKKSGEDPAPLCVNPPAMDEFSRYHSICKTTAEEAARQKQLETEQKRRKQLEELAKKGSKS